jgi:hypothetical protein
LSVRVARTDMTKIIRGPPFALMRLHQTRFLSTSPLPSREESVEMMQTHQFSRRTGL